MAEPAHTLPNGGGPSVRRSGSSLIRTGYALAIAVFTAAGALCSGGAPRSVLWSLAGFTAVAAIWYGPAVNAVHEQRAWRLLAFAGLLLLLSSYDLLLDAISGNYSSGVPNAVDFLICVAYPLAAFAVLVIAMRGSPLTMWARLLDAMIVLASVSLLTWSLLVVPLAGAALPSTAVRLIAIIYALGDAFILVVVSRLLYPRPFQRPAAVWMLVGGTALMLCADVVYSLVQLGALHVSTGSVAETLQGAVWLLGLGGWGAAALSPSAGELSRPVSTPDVVPPVRNALILSAAALTAPVVVLVDQFTGRRGDRLLLVIFGAVIALLLVARLTLTLALVNSRMRSARNLSQAADRLVASAEPAQIVSTVLDTAGQISGAAIGDIVVAATDGPHVLAAVNRVSALPPHPVGAHSPSAWITGHFGTRRHALIDAPEADEPGPAPLALGVADDRLRLGENVSALRVLVAQASLALSRLGLTREISRRDNEAYFRALVDNASDAILIVEQSGRVRYASPSAADLFGTADPASATPADLFGADNAAWVARELAEPAGRGEVAVRTDWALDRPGIGRLELEAVCSDLRENPTVRGLVLTVRDVTTQRRLERDLKYHAYYDTLTGLGNRLKFYRRVELELARVTAHGPVPTVLLLDVDDFRELNEVHGRDIGDVILITLARRLSEYPGHIEAARFDSDTFGVLRHTADGSAEACEQAAVELTRLVSEPLDLPTGPLVVTVSVGIATARDDRRSEDLIRDTRLALEAARLPGHNSWERFVPAMLEERLEHARLHRDLETAIEQNAFVLYYQPVVDLTTRGIVYFEALVRWPQQDGGVVAPDRFIPLAEETGLIVPLGRWILRQAAHDAALLRREPGSQDVRVAVNVSARQFAVPGLAADVTGALESAGLPADALVIELTESAVLGREDGGAALEEIHALGIRLAIDDFGTGYSSLSYLHQLPFHTLKIDRSFVEEVETSRLRTELIHGIVGIADTLGLHVVAEGVETERQRSLLQEAGCQYGQGFLFSHALPLDQALRYLRESGSAACADA
ncbi:GGDEF domain-containing protein [Actinospica durhamensis]|uniref:GGDEF domain-containing protein n=1 Tax=Actinospica durhamensis TaxID=1508375 RepID=A0A941EZI7_9ACTN|nr:bifunctional diguanylate cyclase/phosphodiesterase [Actinospica durhamensis]MBR7837079.1 GGDEF domain-containing protein [Actinospica durhamensis]